MDKIIGSLFTDKKRHLVSNPREATLTNQATPYVILSILTLKWIGLYQIQKRTNTGKIL